MTNTFFIKVNQYHRIPVERTGEISADLDDHAVAGGTVVTASAGVAGQVAPVVAAVQAHPVCTPEPVYLDETGLQAAHKLYWVHVASTAH